MWPPPGLSEMATDEAPVAPRINLTWDVNTAVAAIVLAALVFLWLVSRGFRGFTVGAGGG